jgi:hypothetical protein
MWQGASLDHFIKTAVPISKYFVKTVSAGQNLALTDGNEDIGQNSLFDVHILHDLKM